MRIMQLITASMCASLARQCVLITNANIFDGNGETLTAGLSVLIEGNKIARIAKSITAPASATVIDAKGRTLSPGFIDAHVHLTLQFNIAGDLSDAAVGLSRGRRDAQDSVQRVMKQVWVA